MYDKVIKVLNRKNYGHVTHDHITAENAHCVYFPVEWLFYEWHLVSYDVGEAVIPELFDSYECG